MSEGPFEPQRGRAQRRQGGAEARQEHGEQAKLVGDGRACAGLARATDRQRDPNGQRDTGQMHGAWPGRAAARIAGRDADAGEGTDGRPVAA
jgi:hypothetical protein